MEHLKSQGVHGPVADWIAQSVRTTSDGVELLYDPLVLRELYEAYQERDMWHLFDGTSEPWPARSKARLGAVM